MYIRGIALNLITHLTLKSMHTSLKVSRADILSSELTLFQNENLTTEGPKVPQFDARIENSAQTVLSSLDKFILVAAADRSMKECSGLEEIVKHVLCERLRYGTQIAFSLEGVERMRCFNFRRGEGQTSVPHRYLATKATSGLIKCFNVSFGFRVSSSTSCLLHQTNRTCCECMQSKRP